MRVSVSKRSEYLVFRVKNSPYWQVRFWDFEKSKEACRRSTGVLLTKSKALAEKVARQLLQAGVLTATDTLDTGFISYLENFWSPSGDYVRQAQAVKSKPLSLAYIKTNQGDIRLHIATYPPFKKMRLSDVTTGDLERWQLWAREIHSITGSRANHCLKLIRVAMAQAAKRGDIPIDPSKAVSRAAETSREKGILTRTEAGLVCALPMDDPRRLLAVLLGLRCGMRRGEVRGLQWGDIGDGLIHIRHNFIDKEGIKAPKCGSTRTVPYGPEVSACLEAVRKICRHIGPESFVLESPLTDGNPVDDEFFNKALVKILESIDIPAEEQRRRNITPHSLRHSFISLGRLAGIPDIEIQEMAGHKNIAQTNHYTHVAQVIDYKAARKKLAGVLKNKKGA
ncbi:hypothetical protein AGMMS49944_05490 [Spirochaetia bacterium]|nr:hypothetical protein AGMMS49944_05490 [Spirochaetia bacterium]